MLAAGADRGDPDRPAVGAEMTWTLPPWCLCFPDHQRSAPLAPGGGDAVGTDDGAVQVETGMAGGRRPFQRGGQIRGVVGEHGQPLVQVAVRGGYRNPVVPGELGQSGPVDEPSQHQDTLLEDAQSAGPLAGAEPFAVLAQEPGESLGGLPADVECRGVGDTGQRVKPLGSGT